MGSVNMTHRGMLGNSESLTKISIESDQEGYNQHIDQRPRLARRVEWLRYWYRCTL